MPISDIINALTSHFGIPKDWEPATPIGEFVKGSQGPQAELAMALMGGPKLPGKAPIVSGAAMPMWKTTAAEEAQKYIKHYGDDLFNALKGIDSHPFWSRPEGINRIADIKNALIDAASPKAINDALKIEADFMKQNGQTYSQYQADMFGNRPTHPYGLTDWAQYFQNQPKELPPR